MGCLYSYVLYPLLLLIMPDRTEPEPTVSLTTTLTVSLIITAHNEEHQIADKIRDTLKIRETYPHLEIVIASDASTDNTDAIVSEFSADGVVLVRSPARHGKEFAQGLAVRQSVGDIIVFTDVGTRLEHGSLDRIIELFRNENIGAVSSEDKIASHKGQVRGEGLYVQYEMWLRRLESRKAGLVGLSGSFFAVRRSVAELWDDDLPSDFCVAINTRRLGLRAVSDPQVIGLYRGVGSSREEFTRKTRTVIRGMAAVSSKAAMLNPFRYGLFAFQLISHKIMRWAVPWFFVAYTIIAVLTTIREPNFVVTLLPVAGLIVPAAVGALSVSARKYRLVGTLYYFVHANIAVARAGLAFLVGQRITTWAPSRR